MIFYFSGTGNSKHVAEVIVQEEPVVHMAEALQKRRCGFSLKEGEAVGFVCPVYYSGVPKVVLEFLRHMNLKGSCSYMYLVLTHGGGPGAAAVMAEHELKKKGYHLDAVFDVKMPANYIMMGDLASVAEEDKRIKDAETPILAIRESVIRREQIHPDYSKISKILSWSMYPLCDRYMPVKKFFADERCVGCGQCARNCPTQCIRMEDGWPFWDKKRCIRCMSCLKCNAVQYGKKTKTRRRYKYHSVGHPTI